MALFIWLKYFFLPVHSSALLYFYTGAGVCSPNWEHTDHCLLWVTHWLRIRTSYNPTTADWWDMWSGQSSQSDKIRVYLCKQMFQWDLRVHVAQALLIKIAEKKKGKWQEEGGKLLVVHSVPEAIIKMNIIVRIRRKCPKQDLRIKDLVLTTWVSSLFTHLDKSNNLNIMAL